MAKLRFLSPIHKATRQLSLYLESRMPGGLSTADSHLLSYLAGYAPCSVGELRRVFGYKRSTITGLLDRLEVGGLVSRAVNPDDRRSFLVTPTAAGLRLCEQVQEVLLEVEADIASRVGEADLEGFERILTAISEATGIDVRPAVRRPT